MKKFITLITALLMLCGLSFSLSADGFEDVKEGAWYYDAVVKTVERGIFSGVSEDKFQPNAKMTRAMFVTTLAKTMGAEVGEYISTPFTDVKEGAWYAPYVQWAYDNGITSGVSESRFGVNNTVNREQMVTLFYNTAVKYGGEAEVSDYFKYNKTADKNNISDWAQDAMKWALQNGIISGSSTQGTSILVAPKGTATRAQAAQMITMYLNWLEKDEPYIRSLTINGNPIEKYSIVYSTKVENPNATLNAAKKLQEYIKDVTDITLPLVTDAEEPSGYELIVGFTNREDMGIVTADRDGEDRCSFEISVQGNNILLTAKTNGANRDGHRYAARAFASELLGIEFYTSGNKGYTRLGEVDIPDNYSFKDEPGFEYRVTYWGGSGATDSRGGEPFYKTGMSHNIGELAETGGSGDPTPCLTDPDIIATIEKNFIATVKSKPGLETMWVSQNDTGEICLCENCMALYRSEGSRAATLIALCNHLCDAVEEINPDLVIWTLAYEYSTIPVKSKMDENIVVYFCTIENCASHAYNDPACPQNRCVYNNVTGWSEVCEKIYVWEYSTNFVHALCPMPILTANLMNRNFYYDLGVKGEFNNGTGSNIGEFSNIKGYMLEALQWDPQMTEEEFHQKLETITTAFYGPGGRYVLEYIYKTEEISDKNCFSYSADPSAVISHEDALKYGEYFEGLWDKAQALCENREQQDRIRKSKLSWTYTYLDALYEELYVKGDEADKALYAELATSFYNEALSFDILWSHSGNQVRFDTTKAPTKWVS